MTFVDDEIEEINKKKMKDLASSAKKHKPNPPANSKQQAVQPQAQPMPPTMMINSIIAHVYESSFPLITDPNNGFENIVPKPVLVQTILDSIMKAYKQSHDDAKQELPEAKAKIFAASLLNEIREVAFLGHIDLYKASVDDKEDWYTYITRKGIIYANSLNYLASPNPREHYAIYLQVASA